MSQAPHSGMEPENQARADEAWLDDEERMDQRVGCVIMAAIVALIVLAVLLSCHR